jgi:hypothetical protein
MLTFALLANKECKLGFSVLFSAAGAKVSPWGLRPQARFGAQPPKAALSAEMKLAKIFDF